MFIYSILIRLYYLAILGVSFFNPKAKKWITGRNNWRTKLSATDFSKQKWVWFHCSSYGEFQDGKSLMDAFKELHPEIKILLTFFSPTGFELKKDYAGASAVCYLPLDTRQNAAFFIDTVKPLAAFFIRHDIWPNYVTACANRKTPTFLVSFTLNASSSFLKYPLQNFYRKIFTKYSALFVQDANSAKLLSENGMNENIIGAGNLRADRVIEASKENRRNELIEKFVAGNFCCIAGSTETTDTEMFLETFQQLQSENIKWIIVPHEINRAEIISAKNSFREKIVVFSETQQLNETTKLLWFDQVGQLANLYRYASLAFIGGGFNHAGIHSILEPMVYGCAICFGPNNRQYKEAQELLSTGGAQIIHNKNELADFILRYKNDHELLEKVKSENEKYILQSAGATQMIMKYLDDKKYFN